MVDSGGKREATRSEKSGKDEVKNKYCQTEVTDLLRFVVPLLQNVNGGGDRTLQVALLNTTQSLVFY